MNIPSPHPSNDTNLHPFVVHPEQYIDECRDEIVRGVEMRRDMHTLIVGCSDIRTTHANHIGLPGLDVVGERERRLYARRKLLTLKEKYPDKRLIVQTHDDCAAFNLVKDESGLSIDDIIDGWRGGLAHLLDADEDHLTLDKMDNDVQQTAVIYLDMTDGLFDPKTVCPGYRLNVITPASIGFTIKLLMMELLQLNIMEKPIRQPLDLLSKVIQQRWQKEGKRQKITLAVVGDSSQRLRTEGVQKYAQELASARPTLYQTVAFDERGRVRSKV